MNEAQLTSYIKEILKSKNVKEGTCGYGVDGELGDEPAGSHLLKKIKEALSPETAAKADSIKKAMIGKNRDKLFSKYGKDAEKVAHGRAVNQAKKSSEKEESVNEIFPMGSSSSRSKKNKAARARSSNKLANYHDLLRYYQYAIARIPRHKREKATIPQAMHDRYGQEVWDILKKSYPNEGLSETPPSNWKDAAGELIQTFTQDYKRTIRKPFYDIYQKLDPKESVNEGYEDQLFLKSKMKQSFLEGWKSAQLPTKQTDVQAFERFWDKQSVEESVDEGYLDQTLVGTVEPKDRGTEPYMTKDGSIIIQDKSKADDFLNLLQQAGIPARTYPSGIIYIKARDDKGNPFPQGKSMAKELFDKYINEESVNESEEGNITFFYPSKETFSNRSRDYQVTNYQPYTYSGGKHANDATGASIVSVYNEDGANRYAQKYGSPNDKEIKAYKLIDDALWSLKRKIPREAYDKYNFYRYGNGSYSDMGFVYSPKNGFEFYLNIPRSIRHPDEYGGVPQEDIEMFNNITSGMMDIASKIEAMGFKTSISSTPEGYKGSVDERLTAIVREVYSEKQRKWACAQDDPKFDEMCKDTAISKKKKMEEEVTDKEEKKLKKISKELNKASKMHKNQSDRISKIVKETGMDKAKKNMDMYKNKNRLEELIKAALIGPISEKKQRPDYPDIDGDGDTKEPMAKAAKDKEKSEANEDVVKGSNIKKVGDKWRVLSGKTGKMWKAEYDTKEDAEAGLRGYFASQNESLAERVIKRLKETK